MKAILIFIFMLGFFYSLDVFADKRPLPNSRLNKLSGEKDQAYDVKSQWDQKYNKRNYVYGKRPVKFLAENYDYLKEESEVLDMGMGEGRNAVFLASKGHIVTGIDLSSVAIKKARKLALERNVKIKTIVGSLNKYKLPENSFDAIVCFYFVDRDLTEKMLKWLKPGGILIYEAYTTEQLKKMKNKANENEFHYLKPQELLTMFPNTKILKYEEPEHETEFRSSIILKKVN
tara:strand:- start:6156 stop:6848 length:693 start_codon:yes stop_codon:yes gene_type:complete